MVMLPYGKEWKVRAALLVYDGALTHEESVQVSRKGAQTAVGSAASKRIRQLQELESCVLLKDLLDHEDKSTKPVVRAQEEYTVPESHWFYLVRRFVRAISFFRGLAN